MKVVKFGGSSLADASKVAQAIAIVQADPERAYVVVSAPGARFEGDTKVTDLLIEWYTHMKDGRSLAAAAVWRQIVERYIEIVQGLGLDLEVLDYQLNEATAWKNGEDWVVSRGEKIMAKIVADALGYEFVDAVDFVRFNSVRTEKGHLATHDKLYNEALTHGLAEKVLRGKRAVIPGFYGTLLDNKTTKLFPRNSSDITGAIVAAALEADVYEKFTDVQGIFTANPRLVSHARSITQATYRELGELAIDPGGVFHPEAMYPVQAAGVITKILDTKHPDRPGTTIYPDLHAPQLPPGTVIGIAARRGFSIITIYKAAMNREVGFMGRVLEVLEHEGLSFEHAPMGRDDISIILETNPLVTKAERVTQRLYEFCNANEVKIEDGFALISTVGRAMRNIPGVAARLFGALADVHISNRAIDQGATEMNIVICVEEANCTPATNAIHDEFFPR